MKRLPLLLSVTLCSLVIFSCSKDDKDDSNNNCRLTGATVSSGSTTSTYAVSYNDQGKVSLVQQTTGPSVQLAVFSYTGNVILISRATDGVIYSIDSVVLNSNGMMQYLKTRTLANGQYGENVISYNGEQVTDVSASTDGGPVTHQITIFNDGNLTSSTAGASITTYSYYTDKGFVDGDYLKFVQLSMYGAYYIKNKNLIKEVASGSSGSSYNYTFSANGQITGLQQVSGGSITTVAYTYDCN